MASTRPRRTHDHGNSILLERRAQLVLASAFREGEVLGAARA